jgi:hypothetical protein
MNCDEVRRMLDAYVDGEVGSNPTGGRGNASARLCQL